MECSWSLNKDSREVSILQIPACSQCFQEGKIVRSGQVSGEAVYSTRGPVQKTHQGKAEYNLAGGGGGAASDPRVVEEDKSM